MAAQERRVSARKRRPVAELPILLQERIRPLYSHEHAETLLTRMREARVVLLGESTQGTQEFYAWRRYFSQRLIAEAGFSFVAFDVDWSEAQRLDRYAAHIKRDEPTAVAALTRVEPWPAWRLGNTEVAGLGEWLRHHNGSRSDDRRAHAYGLDLYALFESMGSANEFLERHYPVLANEVRRRYARSFLCSMAASLQPVRYPEGCEEEIIQNLGSLLDLRFDQAKPEHRGIFDAQLHERLVESAEAHYRAMLRGDIESWNTRERHMFEVLDLLLEHHGPYAKAVVWAHNSHVGDHRGTDFEGAGIVTLGGLARERYGADELALVGFDTYDGTVVAAGSWGGAGQVVDLTPAREGSAEDAFHRAVLGKRIGQGMLDFLPQERKGLLADKIAQRVVGLIYDQDQEDADYLPVFLSKSYDAFVFIDRTHALSPLHGLLAGGKRSVPDGR